MHSEKLAYRLCLGSLRSHVCYSEKAELLVTLDSYYQTYSRMFLRVRTYK